MIREEPRGDSKKPPPYPFQLKGTQSFVPAAKPVLYPGRTSRLILAGSHLAGADWKAEARVLTPDGHELPGGSAEVVEASRQHRRRAGARLRQLPDSRSQARRVHPAHHGGGWRRRSRRHVAGEQLDPLRGCRPPLLPPARGTDQFLRPPTGREAHVFLKPGRDKSVREGHPWIFSGSVARLEGPANAPVARVFDASGRPLGFGFNSPLSQIRVRMLGAGSGDADEAFFAARIAEALALRRSVLPPRPPATVCSTPRGMACPAGRWTASATCW